MNHTYKKNHCFRIELEISCCKCTLKLKDGNLSRCGNEMRGDRIRAWMIARDCG